MTLALKQHTFRSHPANITLSQKPFDIKLFFAALIGNTLEYYDYMLYAAYAVVISQLFLPGFNTATIVYIGAIARPIGALVFGHIGDKWSRRYALSLTMYLMAIPSFILCVLPPYKVIGVFSIILITIARSLQAFCAAGELNGAAIVSLEMRPKGYINGFINSSCAVGALMAYSLAFLIGTTYWRVGFFIGLLIALVGYRIRKKMLTQMPIRKDFAPLSHIFKTHKKEMFLTMILGGKCSALLMLIYVTIPQAMHDLSITIIALLFFLVTDFLFGYLTDFIKNKTTFFILSAFLSLCFTYPTMTLIQEGWHVTGVLVFAIIGGLHNGAQHLYYMTLFPENIRFRGVSFGFVTGGAIFGSLVPLILGRFYKDPAVLALIIISFISFVVFTAKFIIESKFMHKNKKYA